MPLIVMAHLELCLPAVTSSPFNLAGAGNLYLYRMVTSYLGLVGDLPANNANKTNSANTPTLAARSPRDM